MAALGIQTCLQNWAVGRCCLYSCQMTTWLTFVDFVRKGCLGPLCKYRRSCPSVLGGSFRRWQRWPFAFRCSRSPFAYLSSSLACWSFALTYWGYPRRHLLLGCLQEIGSCRRGRCTFCEKSCSRYLIPGIGWRPTADNDSSCQELTSPVIVNCGKTLMISQGYWSEEKGFIDFARCCRRGNEYHSLSLVSGPLYLQDQRHVNRCLFASERLLELFCSLTVDWAYLGVSTPHFNSWTAYSPFVQDIHDQWPDSQDTLTGASSENSQLSCLT